VNEKGACTDGSGGRCRAQQGILQQRWAEGSNAVPPS
jgi:hypothetical protein